MLIAKDGQIAATWVALLISFIYALLVTVLVLTRNGRARKMTLHLHVMCALNLRSAGDKRETAPLLVLTGT